MNKRLSDMPVSDQYFMKHKPHVYLIYDQICPFLLKGYILAE